MIFSPPFFFWRERKSLMIVSDARSILDGWSRNTFGGCRSVIDATLRTVVVVVYSTIKGRGGGKEMGELIIIFFFFFHHQEDGRSVIRWGADYTHNLLYALRCSLDLFFRSLSRDLFDRTVSVLHRYDDQNVKHTKLFIPIHPHLFKMRVAK